ncbi:LexA family protein [Pseudomonas sp. NPDC078700]|uniref:LexA family protein n=1 Tax=Pseudomonas sp. NPDC078700 TaxID=3364424 RepID=UPI0037C7723A
MDSNILELPPMSLDEALNIRGPHTYFVRCGGDSMQGAGIFEGDLMIVDKARDAVMGDIVIASVNGAATVKRLGQNCGMPVLLPENPKYAPRYIIEGDDLEIWGVVTSRVHSFD